jgi:adenylate cyclase
MAEEIVQTESKKQKPTTFPTGEVAPSIAIKLASIMTGVIIIGMGLLSLLILGNQSHVFDQQTDAYATALGDQLAVAAIEPVLAGDLEAVEQLITNLVYNEGIEGVSIYSDQSVLLSSMGVLPRKNPVDILAAHSPLYWSLGEQEHFDLSSYVNEIWYQDLTVGYCVLTFDRSFMGAAYGNTLRTILLITVLMVVLGIGVAILIGRRLSRPVQQLVDGTYEISQGNYQFRFKDYRTDELGQLMRSLNTMTEGLAKKEQVEQTFSRYVSHDVASTVMDDVTSGLGGSHVEATVLFADIAGFTRLSEKLEPGALNKLLNDYFTLIDKIAGEHNGHIDKYIGDCAMILFGAPIPDEEHGINGIRCGLEIQRAIIDFNQERQDSGMITVNFSVAINSGVMLAGNMGSERRMEYTVIGDSVNLAARLSAIATAGQVFVTRDLHDSLSLAKHYETSLAKTIRLRGKANPVEIWMIEPRMELVSAVELSEMDTSGMVH